MGIRCCKGPHGPLVSCSVILCICLFTLLGMPVYQIVIEGSSPFVQGSKDKCAVTYLRSWTIEYCSSDCAPDYEGLVSDLVCQHGSSYDWRKVCSKNDVFANCDDVKVVYTVTLACFAVSAFCAVCISLKFIQRCLFPDTWRSRSVFLVLVAVFGALSLIGGMIYYFVELPVADLGFRSDCQSGPCASFWGTQTDENYIATVKWTWGPFGYFAGIVALPFWTFTLITTYLMPPEYRRSDDTAYQQIVNSES